MHRTHIHGMNTDQHPPSQHMHPSDSTGEWSAHDKRGAQPSRLSCMYLADQYSLSHVRDVRCTRPLPPSLPPPRLLATSPWAGHATLTNGGPYRPPLI